MRGTDTSGLSQLRYGLSAIVTYNPESAVGAGYEARALAGDSRKDGAFSAYNITGLLGVARQNGAGSVTVLMGANLIADVLTSSPGAVTHMAGARVGITCQAAGGTATVTNGYGLYVNAPIQLAAQAFSGTNLYGIYIQDQRGVSDLPYLATGEVKPGGAWVNRYAIFSAGGKVNLSNLPTSAAGLSTGDLWNNGGTISIV